MMDKKNANGFSSKATESGSQRKQLPYSVETPYGFHLDLDFLKYVDDIEKGNTIKRVHIQRRNKGPKFSTLPRNFSLPGHASKAAPKDSWASTCTLGPKPKSRVMEVQQIFEFRACESGSLGHPRAPGVIHKSTGEDGGVRVFDEQPLGIHVRPHLLRASSMPVTVLQRKSSESVEDKEAEAAGDSCKENGSSVSVFGSSEVVDRQCSTSQDQTVLYQQFTTALRRIQELEEQVRSIPELQAEICILREEKEQLLLKLNSQPPVITEDSIPHAQYEGTDDQVQSSASLDASVVQDAVISIVQQVTDQQSITEQLESEEQEDIVRPLEQQSLKQEEVSESPTAQEPAEQETTKSPSAQESAEQEPAESPSTQELVKQTEAGESSSAQEPSKQEPAESPSTQELVKQTEAAESSPAQKPVDQEPADCSLTQESVNQNEATEDYSAQEPVEQELPESPSTQEASEQELTESSSTQESDKQNEAAESSSAQQEPVEQELAESPSTQEADKQNKAAESSSAQEPVQQDKAAESSSAQEFAEQKTTEPPIAQESARQEAPEPPTAQESEKQDELSKITSAPESAEEESIESNTAQKSLNQEEILESSSAHERAEQETIEPPAVQESVMQGKVSESLSAPQQAAETPMVQEAEKQDKEESNSSAPEAAEQETTEGPVAQESVMQDKVSESSSAPESVIQEQAAKGPTIEEATHRRSIVEEHPWQETYVTEGDLNSLSLQMSIVSENLTIKVLQEKLLALEGKFSDANKELEKTNALLREQIEENKLKEERIKQLTEEAEVCGKIENAELDQETCDLGDIKQSSNPILKCDASVSTDTEPKTSTDREPLSSDTAAITGEQQKHLTSSSTQTDLAEAQEVSFDILTVEKSVEVEISVHSQAVESAPQKEPCSAIQEEPAKKVGESEGSVEPVRLQGPQCTASDGAEEAGPVVELARQPRQSDQEQEPDHQGPSEPASSNAAISQYVNKIQGLLNEQWACLGSGHPEVTTTLKQPASKFSSIQTQLVSSLNALSSFYSSPGQKGGATRQAGLKSIMKKNDSADKPGNGGAKKNLKFVGVNGGYETTSSEESSGEDDVEEDSSEPEEKDEGAGVGTAAEEPACEGARAAEPDGEAAAPDTVAPDTVAPDAVAPDAVALDTVALDASGGPQEEQSGRKTVGEGFMAACHYIKDRQAELATPDKELRESLMELYQEWFHVSSQKDSLVDTVTLHLKEVGAATPTLLGFIVNLADGNGNTALHYSVSHSNFPVVKLLLDTGLCEVDNQNKAGYTAIMLASLTAADGPEDMEVALQLLKQGNVNARASQAGQTALMLAVSHGRTAMVRLLLTCEADVNMQDHDGSTALMCACEHGHTEITRLLLERSDCDLSLTDREGHSALAVAMHASHSEIVDLLKARTGDGASDAPQPL